MADQRVITLYQGDATPKDIILRELPVATPSAGTTIYLYAGDATPKDVILRDPRAEPTSSGSNLDFTLEAGAVTLAGQTVTAAINTALANGSVTISGQSVTAAIGAALANGSLTIAGQSVTTTLGVSLSNGSLTIAGQSVTAGIGVPIVAGSISIDGQPVTLANGSGLSLTIDTAGSIQISGQDMTATLTGAAPVQTYGSNPGGGGGGGKFHFRGEKRRQPFEIEALTREAIAALERQEAIAEDVPIPGERPLVAKVGFDDDEDAITLLLH